MNNIESIARELWDKVFRGYSEFGSVVEIEEEDFMTLARHVQAMVLEARIDELDQCPSGGHVCNQNYKERLSTLQSQLNELRR